jgi:hypothetical protein
MHVGELIAACPPHPLATQTNEVKNSSGPADA